MAAKAELKARLSLNTSAFSSGLRLARKQAAAFGSSLAKIGGKGLMAVAVAATAAGAALAIGVKRAYDLGGEMVDMSAKTGIAIDQLMILNQAAKDSGIEDLTGAVGKMQKNLVDAVKNGAGPAAEALEVLGLNADDLINKLPVDQLKIIGERINAIANPALRTAEAMAIFGKSGKELLPLFADSGALETAARSIGKQAAILRDNAAAFDAVSDRLGRAGTKLQGFFVGVAEEILPMMDAVTTRLDELDLAEQGEAFGRGLKTAIDFMVGAFNNPSAFMDMSIDYLKGGLLLAAEMFAKRMVVNASGFAADMLNAAATVSSAISAGLKFAFQEALAFFTGGWKTVVMNVGVSLISAFTEVVAFLSKSARAIRNFDFDFDFGSVAAKASKAIITAMASTAGDGKSFADIYADESASNPMRGWADNVRKSGEDLADKINFGSDKFLRAANSAASAIVRAGSKISGSARTPAIGPRLEDFESNPQFRGFPQHGLHSGGLITGGGMRSAYDRTPLISAGERRAMENAAVASGAMNRDARGSSPGAHSVIRRGDRGRALAVAREEERKKMTLEGTNDRLDKVIGLLGDNAGPIKN